MAAERADAERPFLVRQLGEDPDLLAELEAAERLGVSLRRFRGWEPVTTYVHDRGRLASSQPEPEWDEQQQAWMLALGQYRATRCPQCSGDLAVTTAPENEDRFRAEPPIQCFRCLALSRSHEEYREEKHPLSLLHLAPRRPNVPS